MPQAPLTPTVLDDTNIDRIWLNTYILAHQQATGVGIAATAGQMTYATGERELTNLDAPSSDSFLMFDASASAPQWQASPIPTTMGGTGANYANFAALRTALSGALTSGSVGTTELASDAVTTPKMDIDLYTTNPSSYSSWTTISTGMNNNDLVFIVACDGDWDDDFNGSLAASYSQIHNSDHEISGNDGTAAVIRRNGTSLQCRKANGNDSTIVRTTIIRS